jgi:hypothetical protein
MVKSFNVFLNEEATLESKFLSDLATKLIHKIRTFREPESKEYSRFSGMEFTEPFAFDLTLFLRRDPNADFNEDSHFNQLPWEELNYTEYGYAIDANTHVNRQDIKYPSIVIHLILDPKQEPHLYTKLFARLLDILTHETTHLTQIGLDREPFSQLPSNPQKRELAKKSYKYFLLDDEIESMVNGMYVSAKQQHIPLDKAFDDYLQPFLKSEYISPDEYSKVMQKWITYAAEKYPDAKFSPLANQIINSL